MTKKQTQLLRAACREILAEESAVLDLPCDAPFTRSPEYEARMKELLSDPEKAVKKSISARTRVALLIAAAILATFLTACAVFREQIGNFFLERKSGYVHITTPDGEKEIKTFFLPTYIPDAYEESNSIITDTLCKYTYKKNQEVIIFKQLVMASSQTAFDSEGPDAGTMILVGREVIYNRKNGYFACIWEDGSYSYSLICPSSLPDEEIERIILSIAEYTPDTKQ